jgi:CHAD domain-containing protein
VALLDDRISEVRSSRRGYIALNGLRWWEIDDPQLAEMCRPLVDVRALMRRVDLMTSLTAFDLVDPEGKVVLRFERIVLEQIDSHPLTPPEYVLRLLPLKGYSRQMTDFSVMLRRQGFEDIGLPLFEYALVLSDRRPGDYTSRVELALEPDTLAREAVARLLRAELSVMKCNLPGLVDDIDTEFLHDFRVALRRSRSALGQMKTLFDPESCQRARDGLAHIQKRTNRLRDLDVALLKRREIRDALPPPLWPGLDIYLEDLERSRKGELSEVQRFVQGRVFRRTLAWYEAFLARPDRWDGGDCDLTSLEMARRTILKRADKIVGFEIADDEATSAVRLHALRIHCKKLRYGLEVFESLLAPEHRDPMIRQLKNLQTVLGDLNDLTVQRAALAQWLEESQLPGRQALQAGAAIGGMIVMLAAEQDKISRQLATAFQEFVDPDLRVRLRQMLVSDHGGKP